MTPEIAQDIYSSSLGSVDFINNHIVKGNLPPNLISEVQSRVETLEKIVVDLSNSGTSLDLSPLRNAINTGKAFLENPFATTAASSTVQAPGFGEGSSGFADLQAPAPGYPAPGFADPGLLFQLQLQDLQIHRICRDSSFSSSRICRPRICSSSSSSRICCSSSSSRTPRILQLQDLQGLLLRNIPLNPPLQLQDLQTQELLLLQLQLLQDSQTQDLQLSSRTGFQN